jgi:hypothetical protein
MRAFYDQIVPKVAGDLLKKLGAGRWKALPSTYPTSVKADTPWPRLTQRPPASFSAVTYGKYGPRIRSPVSSQIRGGNFDSKQAAQDFAATGGFEKGAGQNLQPGFRFTQGMLERLRERHRRCFRAMETQYLSSPYAEDHLKTKTEREAAAAEEERRAAQPVKPGSKKVTAHQDRPVRGPDRAVLARGARRRDCHAMPHTSTRAGNTDTLKAHPD